MTKSRVHKRRRQNAGRAGFTLIEVLVAVVILTIMIAPIFSAFVRGRTFVAHRGETRMAMGLVERKAEQILAAGYSSAGPDADVSSINIGAGSHPTDPTIVVNTRGDTNPLNDVPGELTWTVTEASWSTPGDDIDAKRVVITLTWPQDAPRTSVSATLLVAK